MSRKWRLVRFSILSFIGSLVLSLVLATPSQAHWADLAVADIVVNETTAQITLTFPTGLIASADDDRDGQLSAVEVRKHQAELQTFLGDRIRLTDAIGTSGVLKVEPSATTTLPSSLKATTGTHSTMQLIYTWSQPVQGVKLDYDLFLPGVSTAHCLVTVSYKGQTQTAILRPESQELALMQTAPWYLTGSVPLAIAGCFVWGAMHALSPGHGKTIVGAYLVGETATPQHALFLGLTTTITHTIGVFALGLVTLFLANFILPEQLYPWLSFISGLIVVDIGLRLLHRRLQSFTWFKKIFSSPSHTSDHSYEHLPAHSHHSVPDHSHHHSHEHSSAQSDHHSHDHSHHSTSAHSHQAHSHLPPGADGSPVTWKNLLALGISGGIVPCPSALVVLLSMIALGQVGFGLVLVSAFSLGLAGTLTILGLLLVSARRLFERVPTQLRFARVLPTMSALFITLLGLGISAQAVMQIGLVKL
ncbi:sulfite exporter TauE/SafE family protein [Phormidium sp. CLA17]|uniref:nickel/cobalt transporter n=1 Tax=Leptolyngbya sp. Cla-17 TaxID=2803751 RepID=UPI001492FDF2|nr:sulfite exporter TauE/SafE family protein [Leptolyngbya sp. Cla-17]MBM0741988.1 sulfite exporter TauE/SafE family protein [Leptolyngbya sp. Cla-17]